MPSFDPDPFLYLRRRALGLGGLGALPGASSPPVFSSPNANISSTKLYRMGGTTGGGANTFHSLMPGNGNYTGGFLQLVNGLATAVTIDGIMIAPTAAPNDNINPVDSVGGAQVWTTLSGGPWTIPAPSVAGTLGAVPGTLSIPFTLAALARTDLPGERPLFMARVHMATASSPFQISNAANFDEIATFTSDKQIFQGYFKAQSLANFSNPANFTAPSKTYFGVLGVSFNLSTTAYSVLGLGDSTEQGAKSGATNVCDYWGSAQRACHNLWTLAKPVTYIGCGFQGQSTTQTFAAADQWIGQYKPNAVIIPFWSPNNVPSTQAAADAILAQAFALAAKCERSGIKAFLRTPNPLNGMSNANDVIRKQVTVNAKAGPYTVIDRGAAVTTVGTPDTFAAGTSPDGTHCNDTGYDLQDVNADRPAISAWLATQP